MWLKTFFYCFSAQPIPNGLLPHWKKHKFLDFHESPSIIFYIAVYCRTEILPLFHFLSLFFPNFATLLEKAHNTHARSVFLPGLTWQNNYTLVPPAGSGLLLWAFTTASAVFVRTDKYPKSPAAALERMLSFQMERKLFRFPKQCVRRRRLASDTNSGILIYAENVCVWWVSLVWCYVGRVGE